LLFLYSRKPQIILLFCWCLALGALFTYATGNNPLQFLPEDPLQFLRGISMSESRARLGSVPQEPPLTTVPQDLQAPLAVPSVVLPAQRTPLPVPAEPAPERRISPVVNLGTALRIFPEADGDAHKLVLEFDYAAAEKNGFTLGRARKFYTSDTPTPTVVVDLGSPWELNMKERTHPLDMPQATQVSLWTTRSGQLRLVTHTRNLAEASGARVLLRRTPTGLREEIYFPR
jgi:hypothetical protein